MKEVGLNKERQMLMWKKKENFIIFLVMGKLASARPITVRFAMLRFEFNTERFKRLYLVPQISSRHEKLLQMPIMAPKNQ